MAVPIQRRRFSIRDYVRMRAIGILKEDDRVELLAGEVREMSPLGPQHAAIVKRLNALLTRALGEGAIISVQDPIQVDDYSEPQPRSGRYRTVHVLEPGETLIAATLPDVALSVEQIIGLEPLP